MPEFTSMARSTALFLGAGLLEIGGGYLVWLWLREGRPGSYGLLGGLMLAAFGVVLTWLPAHFGRAYAAYGGVFVVLSLLWGWQVDGRPPDRADGFGAALVLLGVGVIMFWPRS